MKKLLPLLFLSITLFIISCSNDEDDLIIGSEFVFVDQFFNLDENTPSNTLIGRVQASSVLSDRVLTFEILTNNIPFIIDPATGELFVSDNATIDFESTQTYSFDVEISNGTSTAQAQITVNINDLSESGISAQERARLTAYFKYLALREDENTPLTNTTKWAKTMNVFMTGAYTANDKQIVNEFIESINQLFTDGFNVQLVNTESASNTELYFDTRANLQNNRPDFVGAVSASNAGKAQISFFNTGEIDSSKIWINTDFGNRTPTIKHEFLHAIGLGHSNVQSSILYPAITSNSDLSPDDIVVVRALYHPSMPAGADTDEIDTALNSIL